MLVKLTPEIHIKQSHTFIDYFVVSWTLIKLTSESCTLSTGLTLKIDKQ